MPFKNRLCTLIRKKKSNSQGLCDPPDHRTTHLFSDATALGVDSSLDILNPGSAALHLKPQKLSLKLFWQQQKVLKASDYFEVCFHCAACSCELILLKKKKKTICFFKIQVFILLQSSCRKSRLTSKALFP